MSKGMAVKYGFLQEKTRIKWLIRAKECKIAKPFGIKLKIKMKYPELISSIHDLVNLFNRYATPGAMRVIDAITHAQREGCPNDFDTEIRLYFPAAEPLPVTALELKYWSRACTRIALLAKDGKAVGFELCSFAADDESEESVVFNTSGRLHDLQSGIFQKSGYLHRLPSSSLNEGWGDTTLFVQAGIVTIGDSDIHKGTAIECELSFSTVATAHIASVAQQHNIDITNLTFLNAPATPQATIGVAANASVPLPPGV